MFSLLLIAGAIACSMPQTDYCGTDKIEPINLENLFADDEDDYHRWYIKNGKKYFQLDHYPMVESK